MFPNLFSRNQQGFGLLAAIFVILVLAVFGLLVARFTGSGNLAAAEDYLFSQAFYAAQSGIRLRILHQDGGGAFAGFTYPEFAGFSLIEITPPTSLQPANQPSVVRVSAGRGEVVRTIEARYVL